LFERGSRVEPFKDTLSPEALALFAWRHDTGRALEEIATAAGDVTGPTLLELAAELEQPPRPRKSAHLLWSQRCFPRRGSPTPDDEVRETPRRYDVQPLTDRLGIRGLARRYRNLPRPPATETRRYGCVVGVRKDVVVSELEIGSRKYRSSWRRSIVTRVTAPSRSHPLSSSSTTFPRPVLPTAKSQPACGAQSWTPGNLRHR
jgi:hypothetical protein